MVFSEVLNRTIELVMVAYPVHAVAGPAVEPDDLDIPDSFPEEGLIDPRTDDEKALRAYLKSLPEPETYLLVTVMYCGRGDVPIRDLQQHYREMRERFPTSRIAAGQMLEKGPRLGQYLARARERLEALGFALNSILGT